MELCPQPRAAGATRTGLSATTEPRRPPAVELPTPAHARRRLSARAPRSPNRRDQSAATTWARGWAGDKLAWGTSEVRHEAKPRMKRIGILGGMSWESSAEYYRLIN